MMTDLVDDGDTEEQAHEVVSGEAHLPGKINLSLATRASKCEYQPQNVLPPYIGCISTGAGVPPPLGGLTPWRTHIRVIAPISFFFSLPPLPSPSPTARHVFNSGGMETAVFHGFHGGKGRKGEDVPGSQLG